MRKKSRDIAPHGPLFDLYLAVNAVIGLYLTYFVSLAGMPLMLRMNEVIEERVSNYILRILIASFFGFNHPVCFGDL